MPLWIPCRRIIMSKITSVFIAFSLLATSLVGSVWADTSCGLKVYPQFLGDRYFDDFSAPSHDYMNVKYQIFTFWAGRWPRILIDDEGNETWEYGGVPQRGDLNVQLAQVEHAVNILIPDPEWEGYAVYDFESWHPIWEINNWTPWQRYMEASRQLVQEDHPDWSEDQVEAQAKIEFEEGAKKYFLETLKKAQEMRPNAKWGFYGYPNRVYFDSSRELGVGYPEKSKRYNDRLGWLWDASDAIFNSIYQFYPSDRSEFVNDRNEIYITENVQEAIRVANGKKPVIPFTWAVYHPSGFPFPNEPVHTTNLMQMYRIPFEQGAAGAIHWVGTGNEDTLREYYNSTVYGVLDEVTGKICSIHYDIQTDSNLGGQIIPAGTTSAQIGSSHSFSIIPDVGYRIKDVRLNSVSLGKLSKYVFDDVRDHQELFVVFEPLNPDPPIKDPPLIPDPPIEDPPPDPINYTDLRFERFINRFNPARNETLNIPYHIPDSGRVTIYVYNRNGLSIELLNEHQNEGEYNVVWDGRNEVNDAVASGVYIMILRSQGESDIKKVMVIK